ncbi:alkaline phosphatase D family protein [Saccharothrix sp. NPDC042600]|uniref:alkaline phosphatase D family protein n=1 Tax=Saccharothrix TaxID=2071 RepID=UPI0033D72C3B
MDRRAFLRAAGVTGSTLALAAALPGRAGAAGTHFPHGVASGDPLPDGILLWTRVTPTADALPGSGTGPDVEVAYDVAEDADFRRIVVTGTATTGAYRDHTVKVDVRGLLPDRHYWYRFRFDRNPSPLGRTRTAPAPRAVPAVLRFGIASCANLEGGYFSAYRHLADRGADLSAVIHLGDYLYEYGSGEYGPGPAIGRVHEPVHAIRTLADYRMRHAQYKRDPDLQRLHGLVPFIATWDDHETADDSWSGGSKDSDPREFPARAAAARQAYAEWMPVRGPWADHLYRRLSFGGLLDLSMLDLRSHRSKQPLPGAATPPGHTITGPEQMAWLKAGLTDTDARWKLVGNPVMISPLIAPRLPASLTATLGATLPLSSGGDAVNTDQWDGYARDRDDLLRHLVDTKTDNTVFLTGDLHTSWAGKVPLSYADYPDTPLPATEFTCPSVTSDSVADTAGPLLTRIAERAIRAKNPHFDYVDLTAHGYCTLDVTPEGLECGWHHISDRRRPDADVRRAMTLRQEHRPTR